MIDCNSTTNISNTFTGFNQSGFSPSAQSFLPNNGWDTSRIAVDELIVYDYWQPDDEVVNGTRKSARGTYDSADNS